MPTSLLDVDAIQGKGNTGLVLLPYKTASDAYYYALATSSTRNEYQLTLDPAPTELKVGMWIQFKADRSNTGACTLQLNPFLTPKPLKYGNKQVLVSGQIPAFSIIQCQWDGDAFLIYNMVGAGAIYADTVALSPPEAQFVFTTAGLTLNVNSSNSTGNGSGITGYRWDWGDDVIETTTETFRSHTYAAPGNYNVTLYVSSASGLTDSQTQVVTVDAKSPSADFAWSVVAGQPLARKFTHTGNSGSGTVISRQWNFGDGSTLSGNTTAPTKTYAAADTYTVSLTVTNSFGLSTTKNQSVVVSEAPPAPVAGFTYAYKAAGQDRMFTFSNASVDPASSIISYQWDFGDGTSGSGSVVDHQFPANGTYTVKLTVTDGFGQSDDYSTSITTTALVVTFLQPNSSYTLADNGGSLDLGVTFSGGSGTYEIKAVTPSYKVSPSIDLRGGPNPATRGAASSLTFTRAAAGTVSAEIFAFNPSGMLYGNREITVTVKDLATAKTISKTYTFSPAEGALLSGGGALM